MVDAANTFNSLNRIASLWNVRVLWPRCSRFLFNTYWGSSLLIVKGTLEVLYSKEGVTQGDPLSMFFYAVGTLPLIDALCSSHWNQVWYADDASTCGDVSKLRLWFDKRQVLGPPFGYFPQPQKTYWLWTQSSYKAQKRCLTILELMLSPVDAFLVVLLEIRRARMHSLNSQLMDGYHRSTI